MEETSGKRAVCDADVALSRIAWGSANTLDAALESGAGAGVAAPVWHTARTGWARGNARAWRSRRSGVERPGVPPARRTGAPGEHSRANGSAPNPQQPLQRGAPIASPRKHFRKIVESPVVHDGVLPKANKKRGIEMVRTTRIIEFRASPVQQLAGRRCARQEAPRSLLTFNGRNARN